MNRKPSQAVSRRAFTCVDLLVATVAVLLLASLAMGQLFRGRETNNRIKCASNLKQIGMGMILYANDNKGNFPRVRFDRGNDIKLNFHTAAKAKDPFEKDGPKPNDVTAALFLLIRNTDLAPEVFRCPSLAGPPPAVAAPIGADPAKRPGAPPAPGAPAAAQWKVQEMSNFPTPQDLDYGIAQPYPADDAVMTGYKYNFTIPADFALAADKSAGGETLLKLTSASPVAEIKKGNSKNHASEGQNILFVDGHVEWTATPFAGAKKDNIYTAADTQARGGVAQKEPAASVPGRQPKLALDSIILPSADDKPTEEAAQKK